MSKQGKRKITVELPKSKDLSNRPSVFERLGTKKSSSSAKKTTEHCRQWAQHGTCAYGKSCKFASTHILISPSKQRAANKDNELKKLKDDNKNRLHSAVIVRSGRSPDGEIDNWDQNDLEYADTDVLEKRRLELQRELELQLKMDSGSKDMRKDKKKPVSSSSSSRSSSSSSGSSSSSDASSSSSSSGRESRRKIKKGKLKRNSSSSSDGEVPAKKKFVKSDLNKKNDTKKSNSKKDDKKHEVKKKALTKATLGKKSLSPGKKSGGTPPITSKSFAKSNTKHKSPLRKERNKSVSPHSSKDRDKDRNKEKDKEKDRDKDRDRNRGRSRSVKKAKSKSPRRSHPKDVRRKESSERSRPISPKKQVRKDGSTDRPKKRSASRDRGRDNKDRSIERRKDKHDDKDRHDRKDRGRDRNKDSSKRDDSKRRGRDRGLGRGLADKGLEKPNKPMERLLPRPEERLAALAAISNRALETDKNSSTSKDRLDNTHSDRGRKGERERDRSGKRMGSIDREQGDYEMGKERNYDRGHSMERYERGDDRYDDGPRETDRSPGYRDMPGRDRHYDPNYEMPGPQRGYAEDGDRIYGDHVGEHRGPELGFDDRRRRDRSWEGRQGSLDRERGYMHPGKEWANEDYRGGGEWNRERHWPLHDPQMNEWGDKEQEMEGWHHRGHPQGAHRGRHNEQYGRGMRMDHGNKRRGQQARVETETVAKESPPPAAAAPAPVAAPAPAPAPTDTPRPETDADENPIPDDLSEISDDPDDILNRDDMVDQHLDEDSQPTPAPEETVSKPESSENQSTQDTNGPVEEKEEPKDDDENTNLDFEEISDGELEEERTRAGLGDALGVDWASLVADVNRREQKQTASGGARDRWRPERVLTRIGLSLHMAGTSTVRTILEKNTQTIQSEAAKEKEGEQNGQDGVKEKESETPTVETLHPVAEIQVATERRKRQRAVLFGSGCEITRALSARRDLALRRHLCRLPEGERAPARAAPAPQPDLFHAARSLLMQAPVHG